MDLITGILFGLIVVTSIVFLVRKKVIHLMTKGIKVLFVIFVTTGLLSLFAPQIYNGIADNTLKSIGTYQAIKDFDTKVPIESLTEAPQNIWNDIKNIFYTQDPNPTTTSTESTNSKGLLEGSLYVGLTDLFAFILRILGISISIGGLVLITYLSYSTAGATDIDILRSKYNSLEKRIKELESRN